MAIYLPIVTQFNNKGLKQAEKGFKDLEGVGAKAGFALKKSLIPATLAFGAIAAGGKKALAAGEEVNSANARIAQINESMGLFGESTDFVNRRLVKMAEVEGRALGVSNLTIKATQAKLLTFKNLAKSANVVGGAFDRANKAALDMAAAGFGEATGNAVQLGKALEDPIKGIAALGKSGVTFTEQEKDKIRTLVETNKTLEAQDLILKAIETQIGGTAAATADDTEKIKEGFAQVSQAIGLTLLPILEAVTPKILAVADWARENPGTFKVVAGAIAGIALAIMAINFAMAANPFVLILLGAAAVVAGLVIAFHRFKTFRDVVTLVFNAIKTGVALTITAVESLVSVFRTVFNAMARLFNNTFGKINFKIPDIFGLPGRGTSFSIPKIPALAEGGIVTGPMLALIGEAGPEAVIPLDRMGGMGGGNNVTINVQGGDPQAVVDALRRYMQLNGSVPIRVS